MRDLNIFGLSKTDGSWCKAIASACNNAIHSREDNKTYSARHLIAAITLRHED